jgi:N-acetylneuraminic acid mutarotase
MGKVAALLLVLVFITASCIIAAKPALSSVSVAENSWVSKAPMQQARTGLGVAVVNDKIFAIGGCTISGFMPSITGFVVLGYRDLEELGAFVGETEEYDPDADDWTTRASMPTPRILFATAVYQNKIYCVGGKTSGGLTGVNEVYDPATDTWETKAPMPTARGWLTAGVVNGKIYVIGGYPDGTLNEVYDPATDTWETKASTPVGGGCVTVIDNKIYLVGSKVQIYDPETDKWSVGASLPSITSLSAAVATTGVLAPKRIYVMGPQGSYEPSNCVYDPESDNWTFGADFPAGRFNFGVAVVNDMLYAIGGHTYNLPGYVETVAVNEQYTPFGYGTIPPDVAVVSPEYGSYNSSSVSLTFSVSRLALWLSYSLDGQENVTVSGNTTITGLSNGLHNVTVYAKDEFGNTGLSETALFTISVAPKPQQPEPFLTTLVISIIASVAFVSLCLLVYFKKRKREATRT